MVQITNLPADFDSPSFDRNFSATLPDMPLLDANRKWGDGWDAIGRLAFGRVGGREIEMLHWIDLASEVEAGRFKPEVPTAQVCVEMSRYAAARAFGDAGDMRSSLSTDPRRRRHRRVSRLARVPDEIILFEGDRYSQFFCV